MHALCACYGRTRPGPRAGIRRNTIGVLPALAGSDPEVLVWVVVGITGSALSSAGRVRNRCSRFIYVSHKKGRPNEAGSLY